MKESRTGSVLPFTVSGTYRRPMLALTFIGLRYQGDPVKATLEGEYTTVGGISTILQLTGANASHAVAILLQED